MRHEPGLSFIFILRTLAEAGEAIHKYVKKHSAILNSGKAITNNLAVDNSFKNYGIVYDINSVRAFYSENKSKNNITNIDGTPISSMKRIKFNGKSMSASKLSTQKAESIAPFILTGNVITIGEGKTDGNLAGASAILVSSPYGHAHLHPDYSFSQGKITWEGKDPTLGTGKDFTFYPNDGPSPGDQSQTRSEMSVGIKEKMNIRNVVVDRNNIYLINGIKDETITIKR